MPHALVRDALPRLRRHAYILTGDRAMADMSVAECLKAFRSAPHRVRPETADLDLFRLFHDTATTDGPCRTERSVRGYAIAAASASQQATLPTCAGHDPHTPATGRPQQAFTPQLRAVAHALDRLHALPTAQRQVLSLICVEGFSAAECTHVLNMPADRVDALLSDARRHLAGLPSRP